MLNLFQHPFSPHAEAWSIFRKNGNVAFRLKNAV